MPSTASYLLSSSFWCKLTPAAGGWGKPAGELARINDPGGCGKPLVREDVFASEPGIGRPAEQVRMRPIVFAVTLQRLERSCHT